MQPLTLQLVLFPQVIEALKAPRVLESQLVVEVPEQEGHEDDEESDGRQEAQHLWRDWEEEHTQTQVAAVKYQPQNTYILENKLDHGFTYFPKMLYYSFNLSEKC